MNYPSFNGRTRKGEFQVIPEKGGVYRQVWAAPLAADTGSIETNLLLNKTTSTTLSVSSTLDFPRNVEVDFGGTTADVAAGTISVSGTNARDASISENIAVIANQATASVGSKAFKTVSQVVWPAQDGLAATASVGHGSKLGLHKLQKYNSIGGNAAVGTGVIYDTLSATREGTAPTVTANPSNIESNTCLFNTAIAATKTYIVDMVTDDTQEPPV